MFKIFSNEISINTFPDGTPHISLDLKPILNSITGNQCNQIELSWFFEGSDNPLDLAFIVSHLRAQSELVNTPLVLNLPYVPNARMDRVHDKTSEVFTLKYFANFINSLNFTRVNVLDPHSDVSMALINHAYNDQDLLIKWYKYIDHQLRLDNAQPDVIVFPDAGSVKRYSPLTNEAFPNLPITYADKERDWNEGVIKGLHLNNPELVKDKHILIVDDICSRGGTFTYTAKALLEAGAATINLAVTHTEPTIFYGTILTDNQIQKVFTTNSLFKSDHPNIDVYALD